MYNMNNMYIMYTEFTDGNSAICPRGSAEQLLQDLNDTVQNLPKLSLSDRTE